MEDYEVIVGCHYFPFLNFKLNVQSLDEDNVVQSISEKIFKTKESINLKSFVIEKHESKLYKIKCDLNFQNVLDTLRNVIRTLQGKPQIPKTPEIGINQSNLPIEIYEGDPFNEERNLLNTNEEERIKNLKKFLGNLNIDSKLITDKIVRILHDNYKIGIALSSGGLLAMNTAVGYIKELSKSGLLNAASFISGSSGGSLALSSLYAFRGDVDKIADRVVTFENESDEILDVFVHFLKDDRGYFEYFKNYLSKISPSIPSWSQVIDDITSKCLPIPIVNVTRLPDEPNEIKKYEDSELITFSPLRMHMEKLKVSVPCEAFNMKFKTISAISSTFLSMPFGFSMSLYGLKLPVSDWAAFNPVKFPNPLYWNLGAKERLKERLSDVPETKEIELVDGAMKATIPIIPLLARNVRIVFAISVSGSKLALKIMEDDIKTNPREFHHPLPECLRKSDFNGVTFIDENSDTAMVFKTNPYELGFLKTRHPAFKTHFEPDESRSNIKAGEDCAKRAIEDFKKAIVPELERISAFVNKHMLYCFILTK